MKMIKWAKMLKLYGINVFFSLTPPLKENVLYTRVNRDICAHHLGTLKVLKFNLGLCQGQSKFARRICYYLPLVYQTMNKTISIVVI